MNQKGNAPLILIASIIIVILLSVCAYFFYYAKYCQRNSLTSNDYRFGDIHSNSMISLDSTNPPYLCNIATWAYLLFPPKGSGGVTITSVQETTDYQYNGLTVTSVSYASSSASPVVWKPYSYPMFNISFNLPSDWSVKTQNSSEPYANLKGPQELVIYGPKRETEFKIYYFNNPQNHSPQEFEKQNNIPEKSFVPPAKVKPFSEDETIGGVKGITGTVLCEQDYNVCYSLPYKNRIYLIDLYLNVTGQWNPFQDILPTIKFN